MKRREFLRVASGAAGATAAGASTTAAAQQTGTPAGTPGGGTATGTPEGTGTPGGGGTGTGTPGGGTPTGTASGGGGGGGGGGSLTIDLVDYAYEPGTDSPAYISPGTTVEFVWKTASHNIVVDSQPDGAGWEGEETVESSGFTYSHTFQTKGTYEFHCAPHQSLGMTGSIIVNDQGAPPSGGGGEVDPEDMGVPFQAHYVGLSTLVGIAISLVFTFFFLKYGETPHSGYPEEK
jgi:plastocyanin